MSINFNNVATTLLHDLKQKQRKFVIKAVHNQCFITNEKLVK